MANHVCAKCNIELSSLPIVEDEKVGVLAFRALQNGYVAKNAVLFTGVNKWQLFCTSQCQVDYYEHDLGVDWNDPKNIKLKEQLAEVRKNIPAMAKATAKAIATFAKAVDKARNKK
jgi:hypothetical protein